MTLCEAMHHGELDFATRLIDADALHRRLTELAPAQGRNDVALWPGLTIRRFCTPGRLHRAGVDTFGLGLLTTADGAIAHIGEQRIARNPVYVVASGRLNFDIQITAASARHPVFYCQLPVDPQLVRTIWGMHPPRVVGARPDTRDSTQVSTIDDQLMQSVVGFLASLHCGSDRRVLAPLRMSEIVYRLLQRGQRARVLGLAADELLRNPIAAALSHISDHLAEPLSVEELAGRVSMSPSAFARAFREATGRPPYQYIKDRRLDRARGLLDAGSLGVTSVANAVGYSSVSQFIKQFHRRYGSTPGEYAAAR